MVPLAAISGYWLLGPARWPLIAVSVAETAMVAGLAAQTVRYADLGR
ncbi:hypothetical protein ABZ721_03205 [Streptomyces sp. NPDC006733]